MSERDQRPPGGSRTRREVRRKIAATATAAALVVGAGAGAGSSPAAKPRAGNSPTPRIAGPERSAARDLDVSAAGEMREHRRALAEALAPQLGREPEGVERALAATDGWLAQLYEGGPDANPAVDLSAELSRRIGAREVELEEAFERMARDARERRSRNR